MATCRSKFNGGIMADRCYGARKAGLRIDAIWNSRMAVLPLRVEPCNDFFTVSVSKGKGGSQGTLGYLGCLKVNKPQASAIL
jgi:hypothetical protein